MTSIHCEPRAFRGRAGLTSQDVPISIGDIVKCATAVGMPTLATHPARRRPWLEMQWREALVRANLKPSGTGDRWLRSEAYDRLDPSEKVAISYFLGMTQAALMAQHVLGYSHLVHVDLLLQHQGTPLSGKRPDFVAVNPTSTTAGTYSATFEAKGRTRGFDQGALDTAKGQAQIIPAIRGLIPREHVASMAYFDRSGHWASVLEDPDGQGEQLAFGLETYLYLYYRNVIEAGRESGSWARRGDQYEFDLAEFPLSLSLPVELVDAYDLAAGITEDGERDDAAHLLGTYRRLSSSISDDSAGDLLNVVPNSRRGSTALLVYLESWDQFE